MMTGVQSTRSRRGRFSAAGYAVRGDEAARNTLYISSVPAGSFADTARDTSRRGYAGTQDWSTGVSPEPLFEQTASYGSAVRSAQTKKQLTPGEWLAKEALRARFDVALCILFLSVILMLTASWGQKMVAGVRIQRDIEHYQTQTVVLEKDNERLSQALEQAKSGERIRNLAQNELGMLRPERAQTQTIYIQTPDMGGEGRMAAGEEPKLELLDVMLGLLDLMHIGG